MREAILEPGPVDRERRLPLPALQTHWAAALACYVTIALLVTAPVLLGRGAIGPDTLFDWDPLYTTGTLVLPPLIWDFSPVAQDYPRDLAIARGLGAGRLDLWNPLVGCGLPLWAEQGGPFFPLELPFYLWPSREMYSLFLASRLVLAGFGAYLLALAYRLSPLGAFAAGACFELSGVAITHLPFGNASATYVLPWAVLGAAGLARRPGALSAIGAGVALALAGSAGHPALALLDFAAFGATVAGHVVAAWRRPGAALAIAAWAFGAMLLGLALAAPRLLPLAELSSVGYTYKQSVEGEEIRQRALSNARQLLPIALFAPQSIRIVVPIVGGQIGFGAAIGLVGLAAALAGILRGALKAGLSGVLVLGVALALAPPGLGWVGRLPGLALILPTYALMLIGLVLSQAAGRGVQAAGDARERPALFAGLLLTLLGALGLLLLKDAQGFLPKTAVMVRAALAPEGRAPALGPLPALPLPLTEGRARLLLSPALAVLGIGFPLALAGRLPAAGAAVLVALLVFDQLTAMVPLAAHPRSVAFSSPPSPAVRFLQERLADGNARMVGLPNRIAHPNTPSLFGLADLRFSGALAVRRYAEYLRAIGPRSVSVTQYAPRTAESPLLDVAAVRYLVVAARRGKGRGNVLPMFRPEKYPDESDPNTPLVYRDDHVAIFENRSALPRVRVVRESVPAADLEAALAWLSGVARKGRDDPMLARAVVVEPAADGQSPPVLSGSTAANESVSIIDQSDPDRLRLEATLAEAGLVVIADSYYPGWRAWVDGEPAPIYPANVLFRAVPVAPGLHSIELRYEPTPFRYGLILAAVASLICVGGLAWHREALRRKS